MPHLAYCRHAIVSILLLHPGLAAAEETRSTPSGGSGTASSLIGPAYLSPELDLAFERDVYEWDVGNGERQVFQYRLFRPRREILSPGLPLIVWLHGYGKEEFDDANVGQTKWIEPLIFRGSREPDAYCFFILAVQCSSESGGWFNGTDTRRLTDEKRISPGDATLKIVDNLLQTESIDPDRVYLVGISGGAGSAWVMATKRPDLFAAMAALSGGGFRDEELRKLVNLPIWVFQDRLDAPENPRRTIEVLSNLGGRCAFTQTTSGYHDSWTEAFLDYELLDWLLLQRRGHPDANLPGGTVLGIRWQQLRKQWPIGVAAAVVLIGIATISRKAIFPGLRLNRGILYRLKAASGRPDPRTLHKREDQSRS